VWRLSHSAGGSAGAGIACLLVGALLVVSCGTLPRPFQPARKPPPPSAELKPTIDQPGYALLFPDAKPPQSSNSDNALLPGPPIAVMPVDGAPGDGREALTRAMARSLKQAGHPVTEDFDAAALILAGSVYVAPNGAGQEAVTIEWSLMHPDGRRLGTISQENTIPAGTLDGAWGPVAGAIAAGGADGIVALVQEAVLQNK